MKFLLRLSALSALGSAFLAFSPVASAQPLMVARTDGSFQAAYSLRGHMMFINRYSRRNLRAAIYDTSEPELLQKEII